MLVCFLNCIQFSRLLFEFTFEPSRSIKIELLKARSQTNSTVVYCIFLLRNLTQRWHGMFFLEGCNYYPYKKFRKSLQYNACVNDVASLRTNLSP